MFTIPKDELITNLKKIQNALCAYGTVHGDGRACDCKFGVEQVGWLGNKFTEQTGCPEIRQVLEMLGAPFKEQDNAEQ